MPRVLNIENHTTVGHGCVPTVCTTPTNQRVLTMGKSALVTGDSFVPHTYCGADSTHIGLMLPSFPNVTINSKPVGLELAPLSCGDLALCVGVGRVFVNEPLSKSSGEAADPEERVVIGDYPNITYSGGPLRATYRRVNDAAGNFAYYEFVRVDPLTIKPSNAYTPINVLDRESKVIRSIGNYPGPPVTTRSGAQGLPAYASTLSQPIKVRARIVNVYGIRNVRVTLGNNLIINEDTLEISNLENLGSVFPATIGFDKKARYDRIVVALKTGFEIGGQVYYDEDETQIAVGVSIQA